MGQSHSCGQYQGGVIVPVTLASSAAPLLALLARAPTALLGSNPQRLIFAAPASQRRRLPLAEIVG